MILFIKRPGTFVKAFSAFDMTFRTFAAALSTLVAAFSFTVMASGSLAVAFCLSVAASGAAVVWLKKFMGQIYHHGDRLYKPRCTGKGGRMYGRVAQECTKRLLPPIPIVRNR